MRPTREMFRHWARYRDGTITRRGMLRLMHPIRQEINSLLLRGAFSGNAKLMGMCQPLSDHRDWLWTFLDVEGVDAGSVIHWAAGPDFTSGPLKAVPAEPQGPATS